MKKKITVVILWAMTFALFLPAQAQQPAKVPRIAYFSAGSASSQASRLEVFRQGLRDLGYADGKDIVIEQQYADGKLDRVAALATELVRLKLAVIVTGGPAATRAAEEATATIPIVMGFDYDPVGSGVVASLARPGGNVTGLSRSLSEKCIFFLIGCSEIRSVAPWRSNIVYTNPINCF